MQKIKYNTIVKLLLLSNSGKPLYGWCKQILADFFENKTVSFVSAATVYDEDDYFNEVVKALKPLRLKLHHIRLDTVTEENFDDIGAFLIGGGNTYRLLSQLKKYNASEKIRKRVMGGALYAGFSAGANITGPNILTTNDWNIQGSTFFDGLNLVPFNINPHYAAPQDEILSSAESRDERIMEYFEFHHNPVVTLEEETYFEVNDDNVKVGGKGKAKVFLKGRNPKIYKSGNFVKFD